MRDFLEAFAARLEAAIFKMDFWEALLVFFIFLIALMLRLAHKGHGNYVVTDILSVDGIASLKKHLCAGTWVIHTWVLLHQEARHGAPRDLSDSAVIFYAFFWGGVYLLGPVFPAIAQAIVAKWTGVIIPPQESTNGTDTRATN